MPPVFERILLPVDETEDLDTLVDTVAGLAEAGSGIPGSAGQ